MGNAGERKAGSTRNANSGALVVLCFSEQYFLEFVGLLKNSVLSTMAAGPVTGLPGN